jgi:hypothetical protein
LSRALTAALSLLGASAVACATILDFPDRTADPEAGASAVGGAGGVSGAGSGAVSGSGGVATGGSAGVNEDSGVPDAAPDGDAADALADGSSPGLIECGSYMCIAGSDQACCASPTTGASACTLANQCAKPSVKIMCDEVTDCLTGTVCCAELLDGSGLVFSASCRNACVGTNTPVQLCSSSAECKQGECLPRDCVSGAQIMACASTAACV